jgi:hypothetical protein
MDRIGWKIRFEGIRNFKEIGSLAEGYREKP